MIPFEFGYYRPDTVEEAVRTYRELDLQGREPLYYGGGSEILSMARVHNLHTRAVIDLKAIPECNMLEFQGNLLVIGSCVTLSRISESGVFPLLSKAGGRIADHTMQCRITLGGNIAGTIIYKEAVLPLLLSDCYLIVAGDNGLSQVPIHDVFNERLRLSRGQLIVQFVIGKEYTTLPFIHVKKTKVEKIDYPLVSLAAVKKDGRIRLAVSGICSFPFRSLRMEDCLNTGDLPLEARISMALEALPVPVLSDISGSDGYRKFVLGDTLINALKSLEETE